VTRHDAITAFCC